METNNMVLELVTAALAGASRVGADAETAISLIRADVLTASGRGLESLNEVSRVYEKGAKTFEKK